MVDRGYINSVIGSLDNIGNVVGAAEKMAEARVWVYPCAYSCGTWAGVTADEDYCIANLKGMTDLIFEQEHMGGIHFYTFKTWTISQSAMDIHLDKDDLNRWEKFEQVLRETFDRIKGIEVKQSLFKDRRLCRRSCCV